MASKKAEYQRAYRDRKRGGPPRELEPCGTVAAARRHEKAGVRPSSCPLCGPVWAERQHQQYLRRKGTSS